MDEPAGTCPICGEAAARRVTAREMMFGLRETFVYAECAGCGCVRLLDVPEDLGRFYPSDYYSLAGAEPVRDRRPLALAKRIRANVALRLPMVAVNPLVARGLLPVFFSWLIGLDLSTGSAICDLGSGDGGNLVDMSRQGFTSLTGYDPYLDADSAVGDVELLRGGAAEIQGTWALIMMHHSFEHMRDPVATLTRLRERVKPGGSVLIRVPVADSWAWRNYEADWVGLDPPRHLFIHTTRSMEILAKRTGFTVTRRFCDGYGLQFWGSEMYRRDVPLRDGDAAPRDRAAALLSEQALAGFDRRATLLNESGESDSAGFVLRRNDEGPPADGPSSANG